MRSRNIAPSPRVEVLAPGQPDALLLLLLLLLASDSPAAGSKNMLPCGLLKRNILSSMGVAGNASKKSETFYRVRPAEHATVCDPTKHATVCDRVRRIAPGSRFFQGAQNMLPSGRSPGIGQRRAKPSIVRDLQNMLPGATEQNMLPCATERTRLLQGSCAAAGPTR